MPITTELSTVVEGMTICDADGKQVGTIDTFYLGEDILGSFGSDKNTVKEAIHNIIGENNLPDNLKPEIYESGFFYIECGFLRDNVIILPHQIEDIDGEDVLLNVRDDELFSF